MEHVVRHPSHLNTFGCSVFWGSQCSTNALCIPPQVSARAFAPRPDKKGQEAGEVGIEGTTIEQPEPVSEQCVLHAPSNIEQALAPCSSEESCCRAHTVWIAHPVSTG